MSKKAGDGRTYNVAVVGLSGVDNEKSLYGVGKSCLCNRFVRPLADEYVSEHSSIFSSTDFAGRVLNNDHYLYWGSAVKKSDDGSELRFQIIEQTEFIEDSTFTTLSRGGQISSYSKRCTAIKLQSQEKLMYISRDQVALQNDYEQVPLPSGKFNVDGFVCVFDVSSRGRSEEQDLLYSSIFNTLQKTKKPFVVAATKCDDIRRKTLDECTRLFTSKKLTNVTIVEVSGQENVNVDLVFLALAQLIDKGKVRLRITPYTEAFQVQKERISNSLERYQNLVERNVDDLRAIWKNTKKTFESDSEYLTVRDLCGIDTCKKVFNKHIRRLKKQKEDEKLEEYTTKIPAALDDLFPTLASVESFQQDWPKCQTAIRVHREFDKWFVQLSNGNSWQDSENLLSQSFHVPIDVLSREEAEVCFEKHVEKLKEAELCSRMKKEFTRLLQLTPQIQPGTPWDDGVLLLKNEESYKYLSDSDKLEIFENYQREITAQGKIDYQELLFESAKLFPWVGYRPMIENLHQIHNELQKDERHRRLDNLPLERDAVLLNHIALLHSPTRCLADQGKCMDQLIQDVVATTDQRPLSSSFAGSTDTFESVDNLVTLVVVGSDGLAKEFAQAVEKRCYGEHFEYLFESKLYELDMKIVEDEDTSDIFGELDDFSTTGLCCVFSSRDSLIHVESYLEKTLGQSDDILREDIPVVLILAQDPKMKDVQDELRSKAQELVKRYRCVFVDIHISHFYRDQLVTDTQVSETIKSILEGIKLQNRSRCTSEDSKEPDPDLRILLCAHCGDHYPVELILGPLFSNQSCSKYPNRNDSVMLETFVGSEKKKVLITFTSYHRAYSLSYQKFHGYILVYSAVRPASLATLSVFASSIPTIPIQVLATTGSYSGASVVFHSDVAKTMLADGTNLASKLSAKFQITSPQFQYQAGAFAVFFNRVWEKKKDSEMAYADYLQRSDTLPRRKHDPLPEVPGSPQSLKTTRNRSYSERHYETPGSQEMHSGLSIQEKPLNFSVDDELSPYAIVKRNSYPELLPGDMSARDIQPYKTSTPNAGSAEDVNPYASSTPLTSEVFVKEESGDKFDHLYSKVDKALIKKLAEAEGLKGHKDTSFVENSLYANKNLQGHSGMFEDADDVPPPVPTRNFNSGDFDDDPSVGYDVKEEGEQQAETGYSTIRSTMSNNHDEGYSTVDETLQRDIKLHPQSSDPFQMKMRDKIEFFRSEPSHHNAVPNSFPSDSLQRLRHNKLVPGLIKQFSISAPLAQEEESVVPDYASVKDIEEIRKDFMKMNRHSTIPEVSTFTENVVMRTGSKDTPRNVKSADEFTISELMASAGDAAAKKRMDNRRSPQRRIPEIRTSDLDSPTANNVSSGMFISDDGQTADDEGTMGRNPKLRIPSVRRIRKSPTLTRRETDKRAPRERKRKDQEKSYKDKLISRSRSVPRNYPLNFQAVDVGSNNKAYNSLSMDRRSFSPRWPDDGESFTEEDTEDDTLNRKRKLTRDEKEAEKIRKREEKKVKKRQEKEEKETKKKEDRIRKKEEEYRRKKMSKLSNSKYFGHPLSHICADGPEVPLFIEKCIQFVEKSGMEVKGLYRVSGNRADIEAVQQKFEEDPTKDFLEFGVTLHAVTGALKSFFTKLPGALIPNTHYSGIISATKLLDANERFAELRKIVKLMPPHNYAVFKCLMYHLNRVTEYKSINMMESRNLAIIFWPTLAPPIIASIDTMARSMNMCLFVQTYIEHCTELFKEDS